MNDVFECNMCGSCCRSIRLSPLTAWLDRGDGTCLHFDEDKKSCTIYEKRPDVCNVRLMYKVYYKNDFSWKEFVAINKKSCKVLSALLINKK